MSPRPDPGKVAVVGSRRYPKLNHVRTFVRSLIQLAPGTVVVSGGALGVDVTAQDTAASMLSTPIVHRPKGRGAMYLFERNILIARDCDVMVAFWDGRSRGTLDVIRRAELNGREAFIVMPEWDEGEVVALARKVGYHARRG